MTQEWLNELIERMETLTEKIEASWGPGEGNGAGIMTDFVKECFDFDTSCPQEYFEGVEPLDYFSATVAVSTNVDSISSMR